MGLPSASRGDGRHRRDAEGLEGEKGARVGRLWRRPWAVKVPDVTSREGPRQAEGDWRLARPRELAAEVCKVSADEEE